MSKEKVSSEYQLPIKIRRRPLSRMNLLKGDRGDYLTISAYFNKFDRVLYHFYADKDLDLYSVRHLLKEGIDGLLGVILNDHIPKLEERLIKKFLSRKLNDKIKNLKTKIENYKNNYEDYKKGDSISDERRSTLREILITVIEILWELQIPRDWYEYGMVYRHLESDPYGEELAEFIKETDNQNSHRAPFFYMEPKSGDSGCRRTYLVIGGSKKELGDPNIIPDNVEEEYTEFHKNMRDNLLIPLTRIFNEECSKEFLTDEKGDDLYNECIIIPVHDIYINGVGYGGIQGFYGFFRKEGGIEEEKCFNEAEKQLPNIVDMSNYIFLSNLFLIVSEGLEHKVDSFEDLINHFIEMVRYIQDWETIWVSKIGLSEIKGKIEDESEEKIGDTDIIRCLSREIDKKTGTSYKLSENKSEKEVIDKLKKAIKEDRYFPLSLKDIGFIFKEDEIEEYNIDLERHIIFEYPKASFIPHNEDSKKEFENKIKDRQIQVFESIIIQWKDGKYTEKIRRMEGYIEQMSHNLSHVFEGGQVKIKKSLSADNAGLVINPQEYESPEDSFLANCYNFLEYLRSRMKFFVDLEITLKGMRNRDKDKRKISEVIDHFKYQEIISKYLTYGAPIDYNGKTVEIKDVQINLLGDKKTYANLAVCYEPLYMFLENYIRNVAKHQGVIEETMDVYIEIKDSDNSDKDVIVSLWEHSEKQSVVKWMLQNNWDYSKISQKTGLSETEINDLKEEKDTALKLMEFYRQWKNLSDGHKKIKKGQPFVDGGRGISVMECLVNGLVSSENAHLRVKPVLVVPSDEEQSIRYEIREENGKYYRVIDDKEVFNDQTNRFSMEYQFEMERLRKKGWRAKARRILPVN